MSSLPAAEVSFLNQADAQEIDIELMGHLGFSIDQLMELAGLSVACSFLRAFPLKDGNRNVLVVCGPGNNGGDGLVAARHLAHFGYNPSVWYPKPTNKDLYKRLIHQCKCLSIPIIEEQMLSDDLSSYYAIIDAIFGFSFNAKGGVKKPFDEILDLLRNSKVPILSVDVPSGWDVESGDIHGIGVSPTVLVSLTAPKLCARNFEGLHYLGGRFVPPEISNKFKLNLPVFRGSDQCTLISGNEPL